MPSDPSTRDGAADDNPTDRLWRIPDMSPDAVAAARAAARRAGTPLAVWLSGLIHAVADHEDAADAPSADR